MAAYTACDLTDPGDKLVALAGMAAAFARALGDRYVAGLWLKDLAVQLL